MNSLKTNGGWAGILYRALCVHVGNLAACKQTNLTFIEIIFLRTKKTGENKDDKFSSTVRGRKLFYVKQNLVIMDVIQQVSAVSAIHIPTKTYRMSKKSCPFLYYNHSISKWTRLLGHKEAENWLIIKFGTSSLLPWNVSFFFSLAFETNWGEKPSREEATHCHLHAVL